MWTLGRYPTLLGLPANRTPAQLVVCSASVEILAAVDLLWGILPFIAAGCGYLGRRSVCRVGRRPCPTQQNIYSFCEGLDAVPIGLILICETFASNGTARSEEQYGIEFEVEAKF
ncbi:hypothetical protein PG996_006014 [Apiospora saccharicola]|uniref:Uncharacterized protein n=1 Tax=Apiospora saccharicola TaxID=335842 RepID=A0ABR1VQU2_9PEZI